MSKQLHCLFSLVNRQSSVLVIFIVAMANFFGFALSGGEEQYFAFAKQYMDPSWMPNSFALNHSAGGNLAFQVIVGFLLKYFTFEQMAAIGRTFVFLMYAFPLGCIFRKLRISNIEIVFLLQVLFFSRQAFYAAEWIFSSFEEKTVAYIFVFWSIYFLLKDKPLICFVFTALATYFHFLVGGWMFAFVALYFLVQKKQILRVILNEAVYAVLIAPLVIYLYKVYIAGNEPLINGVNTNAVYAFWRLRHHIGIFHSASYFFTYPFGGVMATMIFMAICVFHFRKLKIPWLRELNTLNIIILSQQLIFIIVAIFDRNGTLMKTYPFRSNSLSIFLFYIECILVIRYYSANKLYASIRLKFAQWPYRYKKRLFSNTMNSILLFASIPLFTLALIHMVRNANNYSVDADQDMVHLMKYVKDNTPGSSVFLLLDDDKPYSFIRRTERERFVVIKFTPTTSTSIYEWYKRALLKERLNKNIGLIDSLKTVYQINYLVSDSSFDHPSLIAEKHFGNHKLYKVNR